MQQFTKSEIRNRIRVQRRALSNMEINTASLELLSQLKPLIKQVDTLAIYKAFYHEIHLDFIIEYARRKGVTCYFPIATKESKFLRFDNYDPAKHRDIFINLDYQFGHEIKWYNLDLILMPIIAVDYQGYRLGQGGGYYDTTFAHKKRKPLLCGVGYNWQLIEQIPHDPWDIQLDYFVSDKRLIQFNGF